MQKFLEHFAVATAAITGVLAARGKQVDLFAVIVLAMVTAFGGGTIRDVMLGADRVFWTDSPGFVLNASITAILTFYVVRYRELTGTFLLVADAFALALFTMVGAQKGLAAHVNPVIAVIMGVTTGVAGGITRDLLIGQIPLVFRPQIYLYATAAFCGASFYVLLVRFSDSTQMNMILGTTVTLLLRLAGIKWRIGLPLFRPKNAPGVDAGAPG